MLVALAIILLWLPPQVVDYWQRMQQLPPAIAIVYSTFLVAGITLLAIALALAWRELVGRWRADERRRKQAATNPADLTLEEQQLEIEEHIRNVGRLVEDPRVPVAERRQLQRMLEALERKKTTQRLEIVAFGAISSGKSALLNLLAGRPVFNVDIRGGTTITRNEIVWPGDQTVTLVDTPGLGEIHGADRAKISRDAAQNADIVLLVLDGPLRDFERQLLEMLHQMGKRVIICLNKADWYNPRDLELLRDQLVGQVADLVSPSDVVVVAAQPVTRRVVRIRDDGTEQEEEYEESPHMDQLATRLMDLLGSERQALLLGNLLLQARGVADQARRRVADTFVATAKEIADRYAWAAAVAGAASPIPLIDLVAAGGITGKMIIDIADVFGKRINISDAARMTRQLAGVLAATLGMTVVTPAAVSVIGSLLKVVPGVGTLVGGMLQGVVQFLVVRWIGNSAITYYRHDLLNQPCSLAEIAAKEWQQMTTLSELRKVIQEAQQRLGKKEDVQSI